MSQLNTVEIKNTSDLVRDIRTKAVLNTDVEGLRKYKEQRTKALKDRRDAHETKQRLSSLEQEVQSLKTIISELANLKSRR